MKKEVVSVNEFGICPKCGFKHSFVIFFDQFVPKEYYKVQDHNEQLKSGIDDWKIIGYIDEKH